MSPKDTPKAGDRAADLARKARPEVDDIDATEPMPLSDESRLPQSTPQGKRVTKVDVLIDDDTPEK